MEERQNRKNCIVLLPECSFEVEDDLQELVPGSYKNMGGMNLCQGNWGICEKFVMRDAAAKS